MAAILDIEQREPAAQVSEVGILLLGIVFVILTALLFVYVIPAISGRASQVTIPGRINVNTNR